MKRFNRVEFAYEPTAIFAKDDQWTHAREPVLRRMPDGSLVCLHYGGGKREPDPENVALITRSYDDGATWSKVEVMFRHQSLCVWPTEIFTEGDQPFAIIHTFDYFAFYTSLRAYMTFTKDSGKTWSEPRTINGVPANFSVRQGKVLSDGTWLFPVYWMEQDSGWDWERKDTFNCMPGWKFRTGIIRSTDNGETFSLHGYHKNHDHVWEPEMIELEAGHLLMYARSDGTGVLWKTESFDYGLTWTELEKSDIPNPGTKFVMFKIDGKIVLVNNPENGPDRRNLELWVSDDNAKTWKTKLPLAGVPQDQQNVKDVDNEFNKLPWICYPHGFADEEKQLLYLALDSVDMHYLIKVPFADFLK